jgi:hypothetical protein
LVAGRGVTVPSVTAASIACAATPVADLAFTCLALPVVAVAEVGNS